MTREWVIGAALAAALLVFFLALPQPGSGGRGAAAASGFVIRGSRVFDGDRVWPEADVEVRSGRIVAIAPHLPATPDLPAIDGHGRTLMPGLVDSHVHTWGNGLRDAANFGVTTVLDMFTDPALLRELKSSRDTLAPRAHADLFSAGWLATVPGGHGTEYGLPVPTLSTPLEAPAWVSDRIAEGSDWIKIVYEPRDADGHGAPFPSLDAPTVAALIGAAHAADRLAVIHISKLEAARTVLAGGADGLVHVWADQPADSDVLRLIQSRGAFVTATLSVIHSLGGDPRGSDLAADPQIAPYLSPEQRRTLTAAKLPLIPAYHPAIANAAVEQLRDAGIDVLAGTDAPNPGTAQGVSMHGELELLVAAGFTPVQALASATSLPARRFHLADRGRIAPGARADLILVRGDPTADIRATRAIDTIWKNGAAIERRRYSTDSE
jgi:imidazolonepropionase-like amidohydrolase